MPCNVLPLRLKQTFQPLIWIFTEGEGDDIESRLTFKIFSTLQVVLINKMDDPTVKWDKGRYDECKNKLIPYLKKVGFNPAKDVKFMPCSGLTGAGLMETVGDNAPWYT